MANTATLHRAFLSLAQQWPKDPIRPNLQFSYALEAAAARIFLTSPSPSSSTTASPAAGSSSSEAVLKVLSPADLSRAQMSIESLERLLDNKAKKAYPVTSMTLKPASYPNHYNVLQEGIDRAKRGEALNRGWFSWIRWERA